MSYPDVIYTLASIFVSSLVKRGQMQVTRFERQSAIRFAADLCVVLLRTERPLGTICVSADQLSGRFGAFSLQFSNRSDFKAFTHITERADRTARWAVHREHSGLRITLTLLKIFDEALEKCLAQMSQTTLAALVGPTGPQPLREAAGSRLQDALIDGMDGLKGVEADRCVDAILTAVASRIGRWAQPGFGLQFLHLPGDLLYLRHTGGPSRLVTCSRPNFQRMVMNACVKGWMSADSMTAEGTNVRVLAPMIETVLQAIRKSAPPRFILAALVPPASPTIHGGSASRGEALNGPAAQNSHINGDK